MLGWFECSSACLLFHPTCLSGNYYELYWSDYMSDYWYIIGIGDKSGS